MDDKTICPNCETENQINYTNCSRCNNRLKEDEFYDFDEERFTEIFSQENVKKLEETELTADLYDTIITKILEIGAINIYAIPPNLTIDALTKTIRTYINLEFNDDTPDSSYSINKISVNNSLSDEKKTELLLKEFSRYLRFQLYKQTINTVLDIDESILIDAFSFYMTKSDDLEIFNEYITERMEDYFIPETFSGYDSVISLIKEEDEDDLKTTLDFANAIAEDIIFLIENFILNDFSLIFSREDIVISDNTIEQIGLKEKRELLLELITEKFKNILDNPTKITNLLDEIDM